MNTKVAIIGNGWVGKAMKELFPDAWVYVRTMPDDLGHKFTTDREIINRECDIAFICVPTPNERSFEVNSAIPEVFNSKPGETIGHIPNAIKVIEDGEGKLDTSAVEECIAWCEAPLIVVRSTVNPGDCSEWRKKYNKNIVFQPEYLGETPNHPLLDTAQTNFLILGGLPKDTRKLVDLYTTVYNANTKIRQMTSYEAEIVKLSENRAISWKVAQCQELYDVCEKAGVDYYTIRDAVYGDDPRFNLWWTFIYPDKRGFNSKCIPKDVYAWCAWAESLGYEPKITRAILEKNKEWIRQE